tara:strand:- start:106 stop:291 length:186 start_codon:yes stop_codon:yes gene_type:complete
MNITEAILYFTQDIKDIKSKTWLKPALISHVMHNTGKHEKLIEIAVDTYFNNPNRYQNKGY